MNFDRITAKKEAYIRGRSRINPITLASVEHDFELRFTHNSTAIEGNTLTLIETKLILEDKISVGGKTLREIYEIVNHNKAYDYVKKSIAAKEKLDEHIVKDLHAILTENIIVGGIYRREEVRIGGASFRSPAGNDMYNQVKDFYYFLDRKALELHPIELAAWTHAEFVRIHPFIDGNGRTSRLIMNYQLMSNDYPAIFIDKNDLAKYYDALDRYGANGDLTRFIELVAELEEARLDEYLALIK